MNSDETFVSFSSRVWKRLYCPAPSDSARKTLAYWKMKVKNQIMMQKKQVVGVFGAYKLRENVINRRGSRTRATASFVVGALIWLSHACKDKDDFSPGYMILDNGPRLHLFDEDYCSSLDFAIHLSCSYTF